MASNYSALERLAAKYLSKAPGLKKTIKGAYQYANWLLYRKKHQSETAYPLTQVAPDFSGENFFGYYDKSPVCPAGTHILSHRCENPSLSLLGPGAPVELVVQSLESGDILTRASSGAYNWQQGCRAHWLNDDLFIFNDYDASAGAYIARVFSKDRTNEVRRFDFPVQDSYGTDYFLSINYRRLLSLRPDYGYRNRPPMSQEELNDLENDGIWTVDYESGESRLLVTLKQLCQLENKPEFGDALHKVNHVMISPSGKKFIFLHRYYLGKRRFDRLVLADARSGELRLLADHEMVSHCFWADENTILGYLRGPDGQDAYWLIDLASLRFSRVADGAFDSYGDGHPHVHGDWFVSDSYPDKARMQHLRLCNWKTGEIKDVGEFFHGFSYSGETRCDLHPRFSPDGKSVYFDSVCTGVRKLYKVDLEG